MSGDKPIILVVEDDSEWHELWHKAFGDNVTYLKAITLEEGFAKFAQHSDVINLIIMDACVPGLVPTTIPLIQKIRETFTGPIIACSSSHEYCKQLRRAGCSHENNKYDVIKMAAQILGLQL